MKRFIIRLTPRDAKDSAELLQDVANIFADELKAAEQVELDFTDSSVPPLDAMAPVSVDEETSGVDIAATSLDLEDRAIRAGEATSPTPEAAKGRVRRLLEGLGKVGGTATVTALVKEAIEKILK